MKLPQRTPDSEAEIVLLPTEMGGRSTPTWQGYRTVHDFGIEGMLNDALHEYLGCDSIAPGQTGRAKMWLLAPEYQAKRLHPGFKFTVQEGARVVGHGTVINIINPALSTGA
jgi:translation elongation factor EF-Tu-like GTPase